MDTRSRPRSFLVSFVSPSLWSPQAARFFPCSGGPGWDQWDAQEGQKPHAAGSAALRNALPHAFKLKAKSDDTWVLRARYYSPFRVRRAPRSVRSPLRLGRFDRRLAASTKAGIAGLSWSAVPIPAWTSVSLSGGVETRPCLHRWAGSRNGRLWVVVVGGCGVRSGRCEGFLGRFPGRQEAKERHVSRFSAQIFSALCARFCLLG